MIVAVNENTAMSRESLNRVLQDALNPDGARAQGKPFRVGDKIVATDNKWYSTTRPIESNGDRSSTLFVAKGEQAIVGAVESLRTFADVPNPSARIVIPHGERGACDFDLAYAITAHKSQGSQWSDVIVALDPSYGAQMVTSREWLYTAISRASDTCHLIGPVTWRIKWFIGL